MDKLVQKSFIFRAFKEGILFGVWTNQRSPLQKEKKIKIEA